jgi:hypothetical protein
MLKSNVREKYTIHFKTIEVCVIDAIERKTSKKNSLLT